MGLGYIKVYTLLLSPPHLVAFLSSSDIYSLQLSSLSSILILMSDFSPENSLEWTFPTFSLPVSYLNCNEVFQSIVNDREITSMNVCHINFTAS